MDFTNFYQLKQFIPHDIAHTQKFEGSIEKVDGFGQNAVSNSTQSVYFKQYRSGQLLVIYEENKIEKDTLPKQYIDTHEIEKVLDHLGSDKNQVGLQVSNSGWQFLIKNNTDDWQNAFISLSKLYSHNKQIPKRDIQQPIDYFTLMKIMSQQEQSFWSQVNEQQKDMQNFLKDKNLKSIIEKSNQSAIKSRLAFCQLQIETETRSDELKSEQKHPVKIKKSKKGDDVQIMGKGPMYNMILLTQNPGFVVDEQYEIENQEVLKKQVLPSQMDFNTCYFYIYEGPGDNSPFVQGFSCADVEFVYFTNDQLQFKVQLCNQISTLHFQHNWQMDMTYEAIKTAKLDALNINRSTQKFMNFNIEYFYELMEKKDKNTLKNKLGLMVEKLDQQENIDDMIALLPKITQDIDKFCNDFYARQPFDNKFFTFCIYNLHKHFRSTIYTQYNNAIETIDGKSVYDLLKHLSSYKQVLDKYKIQDVNFGKWSVKLTQTLVSKILDNIKKMLTKIIKNFYTDEGIDDNGGKYKTKSSQDLESQINFIWNHYKDCPNVQVAVILGESCSRLIDMYFNCLIDSFIQNKLEKKQIIALANNDFIMMIKNLNKTISKDVGDKLSKKEVRALIQEDIHFQTIQKIEKMSYFALKKGLFEQIEQNFDEDEFTEIDTKQIWKAVIDLYQEQKGQLDNPKKIDGFEKDIVNRFFEVYIQKLVQACDQIRNNRLQQLIDKVSQDEELIEEMQQKGDEQFREHGLFCYKNLKGFLNSLSVDICLVNLINIQQFFPKLINEHSVNILLNKKLCFEDDQKEFLLDFIRNSLEEQKQRIDKEKQYGRKIYVAYLVFKFARIIQKRHHQKVKLLKKIKDANIPQPPPDNPDAPKKYSVPSTSTTVSFNTIFQQKASIEYITFSSKLEDTKAAKFLKDKLKKKGQYKKGFALITIGGISVYEDSSMSELVLNFCFVLSGEVHRLQKPKKKKKGKDDKEKDDSPQYVLYFSNPLHGLGLLFKNCNPDIIDNWEKYLSAIQQNFNTEKYEIQQTDVSEQCTYLKWKSKKPDFNYNYDDYDDEKPPDVDFDVFND